MLIDASAPAFRAMIQMASPKVPAKVENAIKTHLSATFQRVTNPAHSGAAP
jgi:hypothetical protein